MSDETMKKVSKSFPERSYSRARHLARDEGGAVAVMFALMLVALLGMMSLAMDIGKAWNLDTQLQHAADACALVGVTQLGGTDGDRVRAIQAAISEIANNTQRFSDDSVDADSFGGPDGGDIEFDRTITIGTIVAGITDNRDIKFYSVLPAEPANYATSDAEARFVECNVFPRTTTFSFAAVVGAVTSASPSARAMAGWETMNCARPQMMMCNPNEALGFASFDMYEDCPSTGRFGDARDRSCVGRGITLKEHGGGQLFGGEFAYLSQTIVDFDGTILERSTGAKKLQEFLAAVNYNLTCTGNQFQTEPGNMTVLGQYINMRFDMYFEPSNPNYRYLPNYRPAPNVVKNLVLPDDWVAGDSCEYNVVAGNPGGSSDWQWPAYRYMGPGHHMDAGFTAVDLNNISILSTEEDATLGGSPIFNGEDLFSYDSAATLYLEGTPFLLPGVDAVHVLANGHIILSTEDTVTIGLLDFDKDDLIDYDPALGTATLYFDGTLFLAADEDIDAVHVLPDDHIILSTTGEGVVANATLGGLTFGKDDLVEYDPIAGTATLYFDGALFSAADEDIDAVHVRSNGHIVLSTADDATLGGLTFGEDDLVNYDPVALSATLYFDGASFTAADEDIDAVYILGQNSILTMGYPRDMCAYPPEAAVNAAGDPDIESVKTGYTGQPDPEIYDGAGGCIFAPDANIEDELPSLDLDQFGTAQWDVETYMEVQHPGWLAANGMAQLITEADRPNVVGGTSVTKGKDFFISRYELYLWELTDYADYMPEASAGPADAGTPICYDGPDYAPPGMMPPVVPDRRMMLVTVANCEELKGGRQIITAVQPHGIIALFLTEPMGGFDRNALYAEVVDPAGITGLDLTASIDLIRDYIVLIE